MGNMSPQLSSFNQKYWTGLESLVQDLGRNPSFADTLYVVKGGTLAPLSSFGYAANGKMPVPHHYFMALLKVKNGVYSSIGFWVEHKNYGKNGLPREMGKHAVSVSALENSPASTSSTISLMPWNSVLSKHSRFHLGHSSFAFPPLGQWGRVGERRTIQTSGVALLKRRQLRESIST